jgi:MATE family multidrug resistance protein
VPTLITFFAYWVIALPGGYGLAFKAGFGPVGVWAGLAGGLAFAAVLLAARFRHKTGPVAMPVNPR